MDKKTNKKPVLKKQYFEILLEDIQSSVKAIAEGHSILNNKIDTKIDKLTDELHTTRDDLVYLIKAAVDSSEQRLTKKIEDGDKAVVDQLTKKIDEVKDIIKVHTDTLEDHGDRISNIERKLG